MMLDQQLYAREKLEEARRGLSLHAESSRMQPDPLAERPPRSRGLLGPAVRIAGSRIRRAGEALEAWATPARTRDDAVR